ncbi:Panacea domain-containing protein [Chloroflexota bacterium]
MATVFDVAQYILEKQGPMTAMKLQKLVYYAQAWSLVWDEKPLFDERIEAWASGPVVRELFALHRGQFLVSDIQKGNPKKLTKDEKETIDAVIEFYGNKTAQYLCDLTHLEAPWLESREDIPEGENCDNEIPLAVMHEYYSSIPDSD